nr:hypothetical protein [Tanacetum cinerariifolium]
MAWTTSDTRYESASFAATHETSPTDYLMNDDSIPDEHVHFSDDDDTGNDHLPKADMRKTGGNHSVKKKDHQLLNLLRPSLLLICQMLRTTGLQRWLQPIEVRKHMRILSVVIIKAFSRYGYDYLSEIVLRRADFQEHTIAEKDFKNLYLSDFEDLNLILLQGHLDHLPGSDKRMLSTAVKLWTRNLVIRQRVEDLQLGIESYQTQLNLAKPG